MARYRLKLKRLDFISAVDRPAQETATALLVKQRRGRGGKSAEIEATARVVKTSDELGLVFGWALTSKAGGADYFDLHGDHIVEDDLIKVAAEFMESGGATDDQHDFSQDGRVVFAMPMTAEVAKAFGITTDTTGLMVAIRPSPEVFAKFKSGEYTGFSIAGIGERVEVKRAPVSKASLYTNEVDGHQHEIRVCDDGSLFVQYAMATGAEVEHNHGVIFEGGALTILAASGHSHELAEGQPGVVVVQPDTIVVVAEKSTRSTAALDARTNTREIQLMPTDQDKQIAELTKRLERAERIARLSGPHKAHFDTLTGEEAESFLAKSAAERDEAVRQALADDEPIWIGEVTKVAIRKRDGELALLLAKQNEANAIELAKAREAQQAEVYKSRARSEIAHLAKSDDVKIAVLKAIDGIADEKIRGEALAMLKGADAVMKSLGKAPGFGGADPEPCETPLERFNAKLAEFAKSIGKTPQQATSAFLHTVEGAALYKAFRDGAA
jgi:hypothetical protein